MRRLKLFRAALDGEVPGKYETAWLTRQDVDKVVHTKRALPDWAIEEEAKKQTAEWMDSRVGRAAMWGRVARKEKRPF